MLLRKILDSFNPYVTMLKIPLAFRGMFLVSYQSLSKQVDRVEHKKGTKTVPELSVLRRLKKGDPHQDRKPVLVREKARSDNDVKKLARSKPVRSCPKSACQNLFRVQNHRILGHII